MADGGIDTYHSTPGLLGQYMQKELPEVEYATVARSETGIISVNNKSFKTSAEFIDQNFFRIFSYTIMDGSANGFA